MARTYVTQQILDPHIQQIVITSTKDADGNPQIRVRTSATVTLLDTLDPTRITTMNVNLNKTIQELGIVAQVNTIRATILQALRDQIT